MKKRLKTAMLHTLLNKHKSEFLAHHFKMVDFSMDPDPVD